MKNYLILINTGAKMYTKHKIQDYDWLPMQKCLSGNKLHSPTGLWNFVSFEKFTSAYFLQITLKIMITYTNKKLILHFFTTVHIIVCTHYIFDHLLPFSCIKM